MNSPLFFFIAGMLAGLCLGALGYRTLFSGIAKNRRLEQRLDQLQQEYDQYQANVSQHFSRTGELIARLNQNTREVFTHLAAGAETLGGNQDFNHASLSKPSGLTLGNLTPPRDYAPRPEQLPGTLSEDFGQGKGQIRQH